MIRTYEEAVKFLERFIPNKKYKHPGKLGLGRMGALVKLLGHPQDSFRSIHVGGTSGKGSTSTIIASILSTKYKTGLHTSPHLKRVNERIKISRIKNQESRIKNIFRDISDNDFADLIEEIKPAVLKMKKSRLGAPSYFEIITAVSFLYFKKQKVDIAVIEVGMGGRFDATNVINPEVSVLTNVGLDHTEILGETVEEIASDKSGIIKYCTPVISGVRQPSVIQILKAISNKQKAKLFLLGKDFKYKINKITEKGSYFDYEREGSYKNLFIPLLGAHQIENSILAIRVVDELGGFSEEEIRRGLISAFIPGRMEIVSKEPLIILDGAHNPDKMKALVSSIKSIWPSKRVITVLAIKEDKKIREMLEVVLPLSSGLVLTSFESLLDQGKVLSIQPEELEKAVRDSGFTKSIKIIKDSEKAINVAIKNAEKEDIILATGSLYLLGKIRKFFNEK